MASLLRQAGGRAVFGLCNRGTRFPVCRVVASFEPERGASSRARGGGGGGRERGGGVERRGGQEQSSSDVWGDAWNLGGDSGSSSKGSGWLSTTDAPRQGGGGRDSRDRAPAGGREWRDRAPAGGRESRGDRGSSGGREWRDRAPAGGRESRGDRAPAGGREWRDRAPAGGRESRGDRAAGGGSDWGSDRGARGSGDWAERGDRRGGRGGGGGERYGSRERYGGGERSGGSERYGSRERYGGGERSGGSERYGSRERYGGGERSGGSDRYGSGDRRQQRSAWADADGGSNGSADAYGDADAEQPGGGGGGGGLREFWVGDVLYGVSPVLAALQAGRRSVHALYLQEGMDLSKRKDKGAIQAARRRAEELGARIQYASKHDLNMVADNRPHQGLVLDCSALEFEAMPELPAPAPVDAATGRLPVWLCLDEVMDPQNFGAALRCAHFLGVAGVLTCHRNSAPLSAAVSKASAGAMELMPVHACKSLPSTLFAAKEAGWQVLGAASEPGAVPASAFTLSRPSILVMGNEGYGLRTTVRRLCDSMLQIEEGGASRGSTVDSLNVSVATGILLHRLLTAQQPAAGGSGSAASGAGADAAPVAAAAEE